MSAAERRKDLLRTFEQRKELKNWLSALEATAHPCIPTEGVVEDCPDNAYEQVQAVSEQLSDDKILEIRLFFGMEVEEAVHDLQGALIDQLKAVNELTIPTKLMEKSPHFQPREKLLEDYVRTSKQLHHHFCTVRDLMVAHLERIG